MLAWALPPVGNHCPNFAPKRLFRRIGSHGCPARSRSSAKIAKPKTVDAFLVRSTEEINHAGTPQPLSCAVLILRSVILCDSFKFDKRGQLFVRVHNETLSVVAMCVSNEDCSPARIHGRNAAPTPTGFAEIACSLGIAPSCSEGGGRFLLSGEGYQML